MKIARLTLMSAKSAALACALFMLASAAQASSAINDTADLEARVSALAKRAEGRPAEAFFASQAQGWLWSAKHEDARNDASGYAERARGQARVAISRLERAEGALESAAESSLGALGSSTGESGRSPQRVPLRQWQGSFMRAFGEGGARLDIERGLGDLLETPGFACSASELGLSYAMLSHARNALADLGWRYADPYFRLSESHWAKAKTLDAQCSEAAHLDGSTPKAVEGAAADGS